MIRLLLAVTISFFCLYCSSPQRPNIQKEKQKILELHNLQREYHFEKKPEKLVSLFSKNFISINSGEITSPTYKESVEMFRDYFNSVEFLRWDDIKEPVIRFSDDGTIAYSIVNKEVVIKIRDKNTRPKINTTIFTWLAIYKKYGEDWKMDCIVSTN
ncbi:MAG TPA: hypothetical protein VKA26_11925 [Ignavibacteriaceae bacterium]|nr:hypothetical protein [Ignavibacteriaceae bacterium]